MDASLVHDAYTLAMLPWCDVVPRRTRAIVTGLAIAGVTVVATLSWRGRDLQVADLLWVVDAWAVWLSAPSVEDRLGHGRVAILAVAGTVAAQWSASTVDWPLSLSRSLAATCLAAHLSLFPTSRVLAVSIGRPYSVLELPMHSVALVWAALHIGAWNVLASGVGVPWLLQGPLSLGIATAVGFLAARILRRPERESPRWWDVHGVNATGPERGSSPNPDQGPLRGLAPTRRPTLGPRARRGDANTPLRGRGLSNRVR